MESLPLDNHIAELWQPGKVLTFLGVLVVTPILYGLVTVFYNLFLHPLRKYPGPLLARSSGIWWAYHLWYGTQSASIRAAHEKYGDVVRVAPNDLSYTNPDAWKDIYGHSRGQPENLKDDRLVRLDGEKHDNIINAGTAKHAHMRRLLSNAFSDKAIRQQEPVISSYVDILINKLREVGQDGTQSVDVLKWFNFATFDLIGHLAFSESFDCLKNNDYHPWVDMMLTVLEADHKIAAINRASSFEPVTKLLKHFMVSQQLKETRMANNMLVVEKMKRRKEREDADDYMGHLLRAEEKGDLITGEADSNAVLLIVAGSETSATLISGVTYFLLKHPHTLARLTSEIRSTFKSYSDITFASVSELPYLLACLNEALRYYPPAAGAFIRQIPAQGGTVCGDFLPGGTFVSVTHLAMNHSEDNWEEPMSFKPERFLTKEGRDKKESMQSFSFGPRNCIGRNLAYVETRLMLTKLLWSFDLELDPRTEDPLKQKIYTVWIKKPILVKLKPVKRESGGN